MDELVERVIEELRGHATDGLVPSIPYRRILRAAFAEVRRSAIEDAICDAEAGVANLLERLRDLLPPAAEEGGPPEHPTAADRAHELRSMR